MEDEFDFLPGEPEKRLLRRVFIEGPGRIIGRPLYETTTKMELLVERMIDSLQPPDPKRQALVNEHLTAVVKTFERPSAVRRLLASISRFYPELPIILVDDSRHPQSYPGVRTITMPFDSGVSAGRNEGVRHVTTPYVLLLDDDYVFYRHTRLDEAMGLMKSEPRIDIMGGAVVDLPLYEVTDYRRQTLFPTKAKPTMPPGSYLGGLPVTDKVPNFFIARTEQLRTVMWEESLKRGEHKEFFTRARGVLTTVYNEELRCLHLRSFFDERYLQHRDDYAEGRELILTRYYGFSPAGRSERKATDDSEAV